MITATVTLTINSGISLYDLINTATPGQLAAADRTTGRVCEVQIQWATGTAFHLVWKPGSVNLAIDSGFGFSTTDRLLVLRAPNHNQLGLKDIYLAGAAGSETARVTAYSI